MNRPHAWVAALLALVVAWGALSWWRHRPQHQPPGVLAPADPVQTPPDHTAPLHDGRFVLQPRADYDITARVLSREDYRFDAGAALVPTDLALGWGRMSDSAVLAGIDISQSARFYFWQARHFPIPRREIETHSANVHVIPADAGVRRLLDRVRPGQVIELRGLLVDAHGAGGWTWRTSLTRDDTGGGACELMYVQELQVVR